MTSSEAEFGSMPFVWKKSMSRSRAMKITRDDRVWKPDVGLHSSVSSEIACETREMARKSFSLFLGVAMDVMNNSSGK